MRKTAFVAALVLLSFIGPVTLGHPVVRETIGTSPLQTAAAFGSLPAVRTLLALGADVDGRNLRDRTALYEAAKRGHLPVVQLLARHGGSPRSGNGDFGFTPLHVAAEYKHPAVVSWLLAAGVPVDVRNRKHQTPLDQASWQHWHGDASVVEQLLRAGADPNARDRDGFAPLHMAARAGHIPAIRALVAGGAEVDARTSKGNTALHQAAISGRVSSIALLLELGATIDAPGMSGQTPLHLSARHGRTGATWLLLRRGAMVDARSVSGNTPLHAALRDDKVATARMLIDAGADLSAQDKRGGTPRRTAQRRGHATRLGIASEGPRGAARQAR